MFFIFFEMEPWKPHETDKVRLLIKERKDIFEYTTAVDEDKKTLVPPAVKDFLRLVL